MTRSFPEILVFVHDCKGRYHDTANKELESNRVVAITHLVTSVYPSQMVLALAFLII